MFSEQHLGAQKAGNGDVFTAALREQDVKLCHRTQFWWKYWVIMNALTSLLNIMSPYVVKKNPQSTFACVFFQLPRDVTAGMEARVFHSGVEDANSPFCVGTIPVASPAAWYVAISIKHASGPQRIAFNHLQRREVGEFFICAQYFGSLYSFGRKFKYLRSKMKVTSEIRASCFMSPSKFECFDETGNGTDSGRTGFTHGWWIDVQVGCFVNIKNSLFSRKTPAIDW